MGRRRSRGVLEVGEASGGVESRRRGLDTCRGVGGRIVVREVISLQLRLSWRRGLRYLHQYCPDVC